LNLDEAIPTISSMPSTNRVSIGVPSNSQRLGQKRQSLLERMPPMLWVIQTTAWWLDKRGKFIQYFTLYDL